VGVVTNRGLQRVVLAVFTDADGRYLVIRRPADAAGGGQLGFCGGKVDPGETEPAALRREVAEELGVAVDIGERIGCWEVAEWGCEVAAWWVTGDTTRLAPNPREVAAVGWYPAAELQARPDVLRSTGLVLASIATPD
jgi:8-oxo-dGTP pyrophosphatase MutT (NUDIX family)